MSEEAKALIQALVSREPEAHVGGAREVMAHPFFRGVHWTRLRRQVC